MFISRVTLDELFQGTLPTAVIISESRQDRAPFRFFVLWFNCCGTARYRPRLPAKKTYDD